MKTKMMILVAVLGTVISVFAVVSVENVTCRQRYPWNGLVDIDYEIVSDNPDATFFIYPKGEDRRTGTPIVMRTLSGDGAASSSVGVGKHRMIWDAKADMPGFQTSDFVLTLQTVSSGAQYLVIDLSGGTNAVTYPIHYSTTPPDTGAERCRTTELWLRLVMPCTFQMGSPSNEQFRQNSESQHQVTLTRPFYIGIFELTQHQWGLVSGNTNVVKFAGACRPVDFASYDEIRGADNGAQWPVTSEVDAESFMGIIRRKTGLNFDLPTEAQWECACRAGTSTTWNNGQTGKYRGEWDLGRLHYEYVFAANSELDLLGRYACNRDDMHDSFTEHTSVGRYDANAWGLYDMHGNVCEWVRDSYAVLLSETQIDPVGGSSSGRCARGGYYLSWARDCRAASRCGFEANTKSSDGGIGFRVACMPVE